LRSLLSKVLPIYLPNQVDKQSWQQPFASVGNVSNPKAVHHSTVFGYKDIATIAAKKIAKHESNK
jgi:hypothetical protein